MARQDQDRKLDWTDDATIADRISNYERILSGINERSLRMGAGDIYIELLSQLYSILWYRSQGIQGKKLPTKKDLES